MRFSTSLWFVLSVHCAICLQALPAGAADPKKDADLKLLQGGWNVVAMEDDGVKAPSKVLTGMRWAFDGSEMRFADPCEELHSKSSVKLDSSKTPKHINIVILEGPMKGKTMVGIFKFDKDRLVVCAGGTDTAERPTEFSTGPDSNRCMITFERIKP
jgi:uncharacterized protein (TIGR03067 family)